MSQNHPNQINYIVFLLWKLRWKKKHKQYTITTLFDPERKEISTFEDIMSHLKQSGAIFGQCNVKATLHR